MCARFVLTARKEQLEQLFELPMPEQFRERYNVAPTQNVLALVPGEARYFRWGLVPSWADDLSIGQRLINARSETALEKPAFRGAMRKRRCVIPASGFIEWSHPTPETEAAADLAREGQLPFDDVPPSPKRKAPPKQPYLISVKGEPAFGLAGLWERWEGPDGPVESCTVLTTEPNELVGRLHNRMPCILDADAAFLWLSDETPERLMPLLAPFASDRMESVPVSSAINNPRVEDPALLRPIL